MIGMVNHLVRQRLSRAVNMRKAFLPEPFVSFVFSVVGKGF